MTPEKVRMASSLMKDPDVSIKEICNTWGCRGRRSIDMCARIWDVQLNK